MPQACAFDEGLGISGQSCRRPISAFGTLPTGSCRAFAGHLAQTCLECRCRNMNSDTPAT
jgi:hypothetical protein